MDSLPTIVWVGGMHLRLDWACYGLIVLMLFIYAEFVWLEIPYMPPHLARRVILSFVQFTISKLLMTKTHNNNTFI